MSQWKCTALSSGQQTVAGRNSKWERDRDGSGLSQRVGAVVRPRSAGLEACLKRRQACSYLTRMTVAALVLLSWRTTAMDGE